MTMPTWPTDKPSRPPRRKSRTTTVKADRWAGTMTHDWTAPSETAPAKSSKRKPRLSVAEASGRVPAPLREYLKNVFKCEIDKVRPYEPSKPVKDETPTATEQTQEDPIPGDFSADEGA
jgi:hypothetical protein